MSAVLETNWAAFFAAKAKAMKALAEHYRLEGEAAALRPNGGADVQHYAKLAAGYVQIAADWQAQADAEVAA